MLGERDEILVRVQQRQAIFDTPRGNQGIDGLPDSDALGGKKAIVLRSLQGQVVPAKVKTGEGVKYLLHPLELPVIANTLKDFRRNQVSDWDAPSSEQRIEQRNLRCVGRTKIGEKAR